MKQQSIAEIKRHIMEGRRLDRDHARVEAEKMAKELKADIYVYMHRGWYNMTEGPDLEHPKSSPSFIVPFKQRATKVKAKDRTYD